MVEEVRSPDHMNERTSNEPAERMDLSHFESDG